MKNRSVNTAGIISNLALELEREMDILTITITMAYNLVLHVRTSLYFTCFILY